MTEDYIKTLNNLTNPSIPKTVFIKRYLPMLFDPDPKIFNLKWLEEVAKSIYLEVDVLEPDGSVAFTTPPLRPDYRTVSDSDINFIANKAAMESGIHQAKSEALLQKALPSRFTFKKGRDPIHEARWRKIIEDCGYGDRLLATNSRTEAAMADNKADANLTYDPNDDGW